MITRLIVEPNPEKALLQADALRQQITGLNYPLQNHPDCLVINPVDQESIKIEQIRALTKELNIKPIQSPFKITIINQSQQLTEAAQQALLKSLEEPPEYALLILTVDNAQHLLETILSRSIIHRHSQDGAQLEINPQHFKLLQMILSTPPYHRLKLTEQFSKTRQIAIDFCLSQIELVHTHIATHKPLAISPAKELTKLQLVQLTKLFLNTLHQLQSNVHAVLAIDNLLLSLPY